MRSAKSSPPATGRNQPGARFDRTATTFTTTAPKTPQPRIAVDDRPSEAPRSRCPRFRSGNRTPRCSGSRRKAPAAARSAPEIRCAMPSQDGALIAELAVDPERADDLADAPAPRSPSRARPSCPMTVSKPRVVVPSRVGSCTLLNTPTSSATTAPAANAASGMAILFGSAVSAIRTASSGPRSVGNGPNGWRMAAQVAGLAAYSRTRLIAAKSSGLRSCTWLIHTTTVSVEGIT